MIADPMSEHRVAMSQARRALLSKLQFYSLFLIKEKETGSKSSQVKSTENERQQKAVHFAV